MTSRTFNLGELSRDTSYPPFHCLTTDHAQSCLIISRLKAEKWTYQKTKKTLHQANRPQEGPTSRFAGCWPSWGLFSSFLCCNSSKDQIVYDLILVCFFLHNSRVTSTEIFCKHRGQDIALNVCP